MVVCRRSLCHGIDYAIARVELRTLVGVRTACGREWIFVSMGEPGANGHGLGMSTIERTIWDRLPHPLSESRSVAERRARQRDDPAQELYDRACDLLIAAQELHAAASEPGIAMATPATLGCLEAALAELASAVASMRAEALRHLARANSIVPEALGDLSPQEAQREFSALAEALRTAERATNATRNRLGPLLAELTQI
jgi:hypothetical protein